MRIFDPRNVTVPQLDLAVWQMSQVPCSRESNRYEAIGQIIHPLVLAWNYKAPAGLWGQLAHLVDYANVFKGMHDTECPLEPPYQAPIASSLARWNYRERWIFSSFLYVGAVLDTPMQSHYLRAVPSFEKQVLADNLLDWLTRDLPIHDQDDQVVVTCLLLILWNAHPENNLFQRYGACCVYNMDRPTHLVSAISTSAMSALLAGLSPTQLEQLKSSLETLNTQAGRRGRAGIQENCHHTIRLIDMSLAATGLKRMLHYRE